MSLTNASSNCNYFVENITADTEVSRRLFALGITPGTQISLLNKKKNSGSLIIRVRGSRLALGRQITDNILVSNA
jgi:ferrous iron transport protein A